MSGIGSSTASSSIKSLYIPPTGAPPLLVDLPIISSKPLVPYHVTSSFALPSTSSVASDLTSAFKSLQDPTTIHSHASSASIAIYSMENDRTLSDTIVNRGHFGTDGDHRETSNLTLSGHKSGFHEVFPTGTFNLLRSSASTGNYNLGKYGTGNPNSVNMILEVSSNFRTDTARTLMSLPGGGVIGHTHSGYPRNTQEDAHDLLRDPIMYIATLDPLDPSLQGVLTKESLSCIIGSIGVSSMAPAEIIESSGIQSKLSSGVMTDSSAHTNWEKTRNDAKARVNFVYDSLSLPEQDFVRHFAGDFLSKVSPPIGSAITRSLGARATSVDRDEAFVQPISGFVGGSTMAMHSAFGGSVPSAMVSSSFGSIPMASKSIDVFPPILIKDLGYYMTEPFRTDRR
ncbi:MAG: hypothetical protein AABZ74_04965 [Cyanobacteriota bacterium]